MNGQAQDVRGQARAEESLRQMALFAELNPAPVIRFDRAMRILVANQAAGDLLGAALEAGTALADVIPGLSGKDMRDCIEKGTVTYHTEAIGGRVFQFTARGIPKLGAAQIYGNDITERESAHDALRASEERYRNLVDTSIDAVVSVDPQMRFALWNQGAERIFGYTEEDIIGRSVMKIVPQRYRKAHQEAFSRFAATGEVSTVGSATRVEGLRKDGTEVAIALTKAPLRFGSGHGAMAIIRDDTERRRAEAEIAGKNRELEQANAALRELDSLKSAFIANMSHELRTPLNSIIGFTSLLLQGMVGDISQDQREQLMLVKGSSDRLLSLVNDVLDISAIEAGQARLLLEAVALDDVLAEILGVLAPAADAKGIGLTLEVPEGIRIVSDRKRLSQVLRILVGNAVKFTEKGGVTIAATAAPDGSLVASVTDTGIGISDANAARLFTQFQQADGSLTRRHEGSGLRLHLCRELLRLLGGDIRVSSVQGEGSDFTFTLPPRPGTVGGDTDAGSRQQRG